MRILWISPFGRGWSLAHKLRESGNKVVLYDMAKTQNGLGYLPTITEAEWLSYAKRSDLIVVDDTPESRRTRRSYAPSALVLNLRTLHHEGKRVIGPVPTTELFHNDLRYQRKLMKRHGLTTAGGTNNPGLTLTVSRDPDGNTFLIVRHRTLLGEGNGPDIGNLGDIVVPLARSEPLIANTIGKLEEFLQTVGHTGYINLTVSVMETHLDVAQVETGFLYPAAFVQFTNLLLQRSIGNGGVMPGAAVTVLDLETDRQHRRRIHHAFDYGGVFGGELHREPEEGSAVAHGRFVCAVAGTGHDWRVLEHDVNRKLAKLVGDNPGLGYRVGVGSNIGHTINLLQSWGWLNRRDATQQKFPKFRVAG